jgi:SAM-dependent methyltransferase
LASLLKPGAKVLEIGAAEGFAAGYLAGRGFKVYVNELSLLHKLKLLENTKLTIVEDVAAFPEKSADCVFLHHVLEHVSRPKEFLTLLAKKIRPGGILFIQVPDLTFQVGIYEWALNRSPLHLFFNPYQLCLSGVKYDFSFKGYCWMDALANDHMIAYTPEGLKNILVSLGFEIKVSMQTKAANITDDPGRYAWPIDEVTGNTPNGLTIVGIKK